MTDAARKAWEFRSVEVSAVLDVALKELAVFGLEGWQMVSLGPPYRRPDSELAWDEVVRVWLQREVMVSRS